MVFTRSAITPLKVNQFGWNLEHCEHIVGGRLWQILGAMCAVATVWEAAEILLFFLTGKERTISRWTNFTTFEHNNINQCCLVNFWNRVMKILHWGVAFPEDTKSCHKISRTCIFRLHNHIMITDLRKFTTKLTSMGCLVSIFTFRINSNPWAVRSAQERYLLKFLAASEKYAAVLVWPGDRYTEEKQTELETEN